MKQFKMQVMGEMSRQSVSVGRILCLSAANHPNLSPEANQTFPLATKALKPTKESINVLQSDLLLQRPTVYSNIVDSLKIELWK